MHRILILDFGSQVTQLIARRVREAGVYCEIHPFNRSDEQVKAFQPKGIILSGGPASTLDAGSPRAPDAVWELGVPVLAICYGQQTMCMQLGGKVEGGHSREFGKAMLDIKEDNELYKDLWPKGSSQQVWMSHGDRVTQLPPGFRVTAISEGAPFAFIADDKRRYYGTMFHPEVVHSPGGARLLANFVHKICGCDNSWNMHAFRAAEVEKIRRQVGKGRVICGLSGGVDSAVAAVLLHEAIGNQLTCIFVDTGLMRAGEAEEVTTLFRKHYNIPLVAIDAGRQFLEALNGVSDPEKKRKTIGKLFIDVFDAEAQKIRDVEFLAQGTLLPEVSECGSFTG
ncbi:MAG: glutamine-hydrolyzing GMP synthase, partial [Bdellovibrionales bacterium]